MKMPLNLSLPKAHKKDVLLISLSLFILVMFILFFLQTHMSEQKAVSLNQQNSVLTNDLRKSQEKLAILQNEDQYKKNKKLEGEIANINTLYKKAGSTYESIVDLRDQKVNTTDLEKQYVQVVNSLADRNYSSASAGLAEENKNIKTEQDKLAAAQAASQAPQQAGFAASANLPTSNTLNAGLNQQKVHSDVGDFQVTVIAADLNSTRVIVDTASDGDCHDNCPVLPLGDYVSRNGAYAGINGNYFCPSTYPSCAGKANSFDLLVMNKNKHYFNSDNNVYSNNPVAVFSGSSARFIGAASGWGRDTSADAVIMNYPLLVSDNNIAYGGGSDPKMGSKGARCFIGSTGSTVYIGIVYNATMTEAAHVVHSMAIANAMNLDEGGSTALMWQGRYLAGPGRSLPDAVLFVHK